MLLLFIFAPPITSTPHSIIHSVMGPSKEFARAESSPSPDFESQLSELTGEFDSQLSVAYGVHASTPSTDDSTLLNVPAEIREIRRRCFDLKERVIWSAAEFESN